MVIIIAFIAVWYLSLFAQTFFHHRYASHGAFTMSKGWERFFFIFTYITQGSHYLSPRAYAIMHRMHHAYADTPQDPHSPSYSSGLIDMMLRTWRYYDNIFSERIEIEPRFKKNLPEWKSFDKWANSWISRVLWIAAYVLFFIKFATTPWAYLLLPMILIMAPLHGAVINWFAHKYGYINFRMKNTSRNLFSIDILMLGESYHNNHHKHPSSINFGRRWHEIDPVYPIIRLLAWMGIVKLRTVPLVFEEQKTEASARKLEKVSDLDY